MTQNRPEPQADPEPADSRATRERFEALADKIRQESHLPSQDDQSWREREAIRLSAYDRGYMPPQGGQSWRDREAMLFAPAREMDTADVDKEPEPPLSVPPPISTARGGQGGIVLAFFMVVAIALAVVALAHPEMLTSAYWRTPNIRTNTVTPPPRAVQPPPSSAIEPAAPQAERPQPTVPASDLTPAPSDSAPSAAKAPPPSAPLVIDAAKGARQAPAPKPASRPRASARDDRGTSGFYAKVPGPDGTLQNQYFPSEAKPGSEPIAPPPASDHSTNGFYARVPGPDGTLEYQFFPAKPPR